MAHPPLDRIGPHTAHLCIDMQNMYLPGSPWHAPWIERVLPNVLRLAQHHPSCNVFTRFIPPHRSTERSGRWKKYFDQWHALTQAEAPPHYIELIDPLRALASTGSVVDKPAYCPFYGTGLAALLQERHIDTVILSGTETDVCVASAVFACIDHGWRTIVAADAVCSSADETHDKQLRLYRSRFSLQLEVAGIDDIFQAWR
ncbi:Maleamate amidohydrolase [Amantichitinum ursilacus]|uniref:Maleamate amidohydrolase n=2 Tax=Amantichitinum ursilacus TaxID=857265 RepID=A0A0N0GN23_9NEIS|nr:Maleamate amidohydrolase [Amantichitinum ursilacus]